MRAFIVSLSVTTCAFPAFGQPGSFDVPEDIWPADLEWRGIERPRFPVITRFGEISISQSGGAETGRPRITEVSLNDVTVVPRFAGDSSIVSINNVVQMGDQDIVIFSADQGGSGSPPGTFNLLPLGAEGIGQMVAEPELRSVDGFVRIAVTEDHIYFDLGFQDGLRRSAKWSADGVEIELFEVNVDSLPMEDCWRLYSTVGSGMCRENHQFSLATQRWLSSLNHHPAFDQDVIYQMCMDTGEGLSFPITEEVEPPPFYEDFQARVCSARR